jgi:hypothetical protein
MDPLQQALKAKEGQVFYNIPSKYEQMFKTKKYDLEHFGLSFFQRAMCFSGCLVLGMLSFLYSMFKIATAVFRPAAFVIPYTFSNFVFFMMFGFLLGFKSYLRNLFSEKKYMYTSSFVVSTLVTIWTVLKYDNYFLTGFVTIMQVMAFLVFALTFVPGGASGMSSMVSMFLRK